MDQFQKETHKFLEELKSGASNILVAVRVRPLNQKERSISEFETIRILDGKVVVLLDPGQEGNDDVLRKNRSKETQFAFDFVFDQWAPQQQIYENTTEFLLDGVLEGYNTTVFCYGATGSGKTFSMIGSNQEIGIMPRATQSLFNFAQGEQFKDISFKMQYVEIYNENIRDLLSQEDKNLEIREDKNQGIQISGVVEIDVKTVQEVMALLKVGNKNRSKESTDANRESSRSHAIFSINVEGKEKASGVQEQIIQSKFSMVDLAGSERAANTNNKGIRMVEGAKINQSLLVLGNCIQSLSEANEKNIKNPFIPYRNSKLTRLLKDSLGGNCRTVMISNVSPAASAFEETYNTLVYANRAKNIKTVANRNVLNAQNHISNYAQLIQNLRQENEELKQLIQQQQISNNPTPKLTLPSIHAKPVQNIKQQINELEQLINQSIQDIIETKNKLFDMEEQQIHYSQNIQFLTSQKQRTQDKFEQMRLAERIDNAKTQKQIVQRSQQDMEHQLLEYEVRKTDIQKAVQQISDLNYRQFLQGVVKQGELKIETIELKQQEKKQRLQEQQQEDQLKHLRTQIKQQQNTKVLSAKSKTIPKKNVQKSLRPNVPSLPGVDSPYPVSITNAYNQYKYQHKKSNLKLPPVTLLTHGQKSPKVINNNLKYRMGQRYSTRGNRPPSYRPPSSQKSALGRYVNKSLDLGNQSNSISNLQSSVSLRRLKKLHNQYQEERFDRALSGRRKNPTSLPYLGGKILLPGMVHQSPYVQNFKKDLDPIEVKKERLKMLNINLRAQHGEKFQIN